MKNFLEELGERLDDLSRCGLERRLVVGSGVDFASNDYLGLGKDAAFRDAVLAAIQECPIDTFSSPASRLLSGNSREHEQVEARFAAFKGCEAALLFSSGYTANLAVLASLIGPDDTVLSDEQNHASIIDGLRLSRCHKQIFRHLDLSHIEELLKRKEQTPGRTFIVTETLFSMDGDIAPIDDYAALAERYNAELILDDAHATGVFSVERGAGLAKVANAARKPLAIVSTFGKAFALGGAMVTGSRVMIDYLVSRARPFIFTTAPVPFLARAMNVSLDFVAQGVNRRRHLLALADKTRKLLRRGGFDCLNSSGPIIPVILGDNATATSVAAAIQRGGFDVRAIRPPSVAPGTARLRLSLHADHTDDQIAALVDLLGKTAEAQQVSAASRTFEP